MQNLTPYTECRNFQCLFGRFRLSSDWCEWHCSVCLLRVCLLYISLHCVALHYTYTITRAHMYIYIYMTAYHWKQLMRPHSITSNKKAPPTPILHALGVKPLYKALAPGSECCQCGRINLHQQQHVNHKARCTHLTLTMNRSLMEFATFLLENVKQNAKGGPAHCLQPLEQGQGVVFLQWSCAVKSLPSSYSHQTE